MPAATTAHPQASYYRRTRSKFVRTQNQLREELSFPAEPTNAQLIALHTVIAYYQTQIDTLDALHAEGKL